MRPPLLPSRARRLFRSTHSADAAFATVAALGSITYLVLGRHLWFYSDEWDYVVDRHPVSDPASLFRPHNGQWQTIPILIYRVLLSFTGVRHYWPYLGLVVVLYVTTCALTYLLMRRCGVRPWIAIVPASALVFLGVANENVIFGAQITYLGSIALGLGQLLLLSATWTTRRAVLVVVMGAAALMCSNLGVVTAVVVALAVLFRRGWRSAAAVTVLPAIAFVLWWTAYGSASSSGLWRVVTFAWIGLRGTGRGYGQHGDFGFAALSVVLVAGLVLVALTSDQREKLSIAVALAVGALVFLVVTGSQRVTAFGAESAAAPRYVGVVAILLVPVAGIAADALWSRWRAAGVLAVALLLMGVPGNISALGGIHSRSDHIAATRRLILTLPVLPATATVPADLRPFPESFLAPLLTVGWVRAAARSGDLPSVRHPTPADRSTVRFRLRLYQTFAAGKPVGCRILTAPVTVPVAEGDALRISGGFVSVTDLSPGSEYGRRMTYNPNRGNVLRVLSGTLRLRLASAGTNGRAELCRR